MVDHFPQTFKEHKNESQKLCKQSSVCGHHMAGWPLCQYVLSFVPIMRFLQSQILCRLSKSPSDKTICIYYKLRYLYLTNICMQKDHI